MYLCQSVCMPSCVMAIADKQQHRIVILQLDCYCAMRLFFSLSITAVMKYTMPSRVKVEQNQNTDLSSCDEDGCASSSWTLVQGQKASLSLAHALAGESKMQLTCMFSVYVSEKHSGIRKSQQTSAICIAVTKKNGWVEPIISS